MIYMLQNYMVFNSEPLTFEDKDQYFCDEKQSKIPAIHVEQYLVW